MRRFVVTFLALSLAVLVIAPVPAFACKGVCVGNFCATSEESTGMTCYYSNGQCYESMCMEEAAKLEIAMVFSSASGGLAIFTAAPRTTAVSAIPASSVSLASCSN